MTDLNYRKKSLTETVSSSSTGSSPEEEGRLKALFMSCDSNNDGRLDKADLITMCKKLNMAELAEEIICALGTNAKGSTISFPEFLHCRSQILKGAEINQPEAEYLHYYSQSQYDQVRGSSSDLSQIYSSVDYDSGTQETHEEPLSLHAMLHQCYPDLYNQWTSSQLDHNNTLFQHLLQCANHIHLARLNRLYTELKLTLKRINSANTSRDLCQKEISRTQKERDKLKAELQNQGSRYEDRLTELHSVIAELQKKIEKKDKNVIKEEDEETMNEEDRNNVEDYEKLDMVKFSTFNKDMRRSSTASLLDNTCSMERSMIMDPIQPVRTTIESQTDVSVKSDFRVINIQKNDFVNDKIQEVAEKQLKSFHYNNIYLQEKLSGYENVVSNLRTQLGSVVEEREMLRKQLKELQDSVEVGNMANALYPPYSSSCSMSKVSLDSKSTNSSSSSPARPIMGVRQQSKQIQLKSQPPEPEWVSKAVSRFQRSLHGSNSNSNVQGMISGYLNEDSNFIQTSGLLFLQELADNVPYPSMTEPCKRIYMEWQRLVAISDRESADKLLLESTLAESKSISDQLQCSLVQLQSDCVVLSKSGILADQIIELADIMIQLQETDPLGGFIDINNQSAMLDPCYQNSSFNNSLDHHGNNLKEVSQLRHGFREQLESAAKLFLYRLECYGSMGRQTPDSGAGVSSTLSSGGGSVDVEGVLRQTSGSGDWNKTDEMKLRRLLEQLMSERSRTKLSMSGTHLGQSFYGQPSSNQSSLKRRQGDHICSYTLDSSLSCHHQQFIESAILLQEVCTLKEERATLKTNIYLLEKEIKSLQLALESRISAEKSLKVQLTQMMQQRSDNNSASTSEDIRTLKVQVNDLLQVLEELRERSQLQQQQNEEFVNDLKRANAALISAFDKAKKKYQCKISRLEQQLSNIPHTVMGSDETAL